VVFSSITFLLFFFPLFLLFYYVAPKKLRNVVILLFSIAFYSWGAPRFIFVILGTTFIDFQLVRLMWNSKDDRWRKAFLALSVCMNVGLLAYFKYSNFFIDNVNIVLESIGMHQVGWTRVIMPLGISFYTFETITYIVDVYRRVHGPLRRFWDYQLYIILFPKLIAGPIIRYHDIADQIDNRDANETWNRRFYGLYRFVIGLAKKVVLANNMGVMADQIFNIPFHQLGMPDAWIGLLAYTFQIYFDFSGYSDMAIGIAALIGFKFPENFNNPYVSLSVTDFWHRWHISLSTWMRNYLYIPLGGNRVNSKWRLYFNLWFVFLLSGFWHGASWTYIAFGAYHGGFLVAEKFFLGKQLEKLGKLPRILFAFAVVMGGNIIFRSDTIADAWAFFLRLFSFHFPKGIKADKEFFAYLAIAVFFGFFTAVPAGLRIHDKVFKEEYTPRKHALMFSICVVLIIISVGAMSTYGFNPFLYFRF